MYPSGKKTFKLHSNALFPSVNVISFLRLDVRFADFHTPSLENPQTGFIVFIQIQFVIFFFNG
jgi:hypothetical protein